MVGFSTFWLILTLVFLSSIILGAFSVFANLLLRLTFKLCPNEDLAFWTIVVIVGLNILYSLYGAWSMVINISGKFVGVAIIYTILLLELSGAMVYGALKSIDEDNSRSSNLS